jgi:hypothetical protein
MMHNARDWRSSRINRKSGGSCGCAAIVILAIIGFIIYYYFFA